MCVRVCTHGCVRVCEINEIMGSHLAGIDLFCCVCVYVCMCACVRVSVCVCACVHA